ncbi:MAG TPA: MFS transporter [Gemmatimonadaceae bacterium]|nr:MFS transporter [Gemmatimonadaceae bacterium]
MDDPSSRTLLRDRNFLRLWWGQLVSMAGDGLTYLALAGLLLQHSREHSGASFAALMAVLANVMVAPVLLLAPFTGAWIDRLDLKRVLVASDAVRAAIVLAIPWVYGFGGGTPPVFALVFLLFAVNVAFLPAKSALVPEIVPAGRLLAANSLLALAGVAAIGAGALAGGLIVDRWGWAVAMRIDAVTYLVSVVMLSSISYQPVVRHARRVAVTVRGYASDVREGWMLLRRNGAVRVGLMALAAVWFTGGVLHVAGNAHVQAAAATPGMRRLGALLFAIGVGSALGTWWVNTHGRALPRGRVLGAALFLAGLALVPFGASGQFWVFVVAACVAGMFAAPVLVLSETVLQDGTAVEHRARVFSARDFLMRATLLASVTFTAWATSRVGTGGALVIGGVVMAVAGGVVLLRERRRVVEQPSGVVAPDGVLARQAPGHVAAGWASDTRD